MSPASDPGLAPLPYPPPEMRALVGPTELEAFDNPDGALVYPYLSAAQYREVLDFGCGCGRVARQLILQQPRPQRYLGIDLHRGMIDWAAQNLSPAADGFEFVHHDVFNRSFNPGTGLPDTAPFPAPDASFTLVNALSVFTHLTEPGARFYLQEVSRVLAPDGVAHASFFLIDKTQFPMMMAHTNALYVSYEEPTAAVLFDREWVCRTAEQAGLTITAIVPPRIRGYQWVLMMEHSRSGLEQAPFPSDDAPPGEVRTPPMPADAHRIGRRQADAG
jgi:SAM-dependent methyltransferase